MRAVARPELEECNSGFLGEGFSLISLWAVLLVLLIL